jgi:1-acyl-sn-glycerol-3-phosphate acyltransferase
MTQSTNESGALMKTNDFSRLTPAQRCWVSSLLALFGKMVTVKNPENLTGASAPAIFAFNHNNVLETILVPIYLFSLLGEQKFSFVVDWMFGRIPGINWFLKQIDPIYVYSKPSTLTWLNTVRNRVGRPPALGQCLARLKQGQSLGLFPEGTRNHNPLTLLKAKKGLGHLVLLSQAPVIPIGIDFPNRAKLQKIPAFGPLILRIGTPLRFNITQSILRKVTALSQFSAAELKKIQNILAARVTHQIMEQIAELSGKNYPYPLPSVPPDFRPWLSPLFKNYTKEGGEHDGLYGNSNSQSH